MPCGPDEQRSSGKYERHGTLELSDSSKRYSVSCSSELRVGCELPSWRVVSVKIVIKKVKVKLESERITIVFVIERYESLWELGTI